MSGSYGCPGGVSSFARSTESFSSDFHAWPPAAASDVTARSVNSYRKFRSSLYQTMIGSCKLGMRQLIANGDMGILPWRHVSPNANYAGITSRRTSPTHALQGEKENLFDKTKSFAKRVEIIRRAEERRRHRPSRAFKNI